MSSLLAVLCPLMSNIDLFFCFRYTTEAPELQMRRLADLAFLFQMYDFAYRTYHTAKRDFNNDHAWLHYAGALVCIIHFILLLVYQTRDSS